MKLLLDTHVWLWFVRGEAALPRAFDTAIRDPANAVVLSIVSAWEVQIKTAIGKLQVEIASPHTTVVPFAPLAVDADPLRMKVVVDEAAVVSPTALG